LKVLITAATTAKAYKLQRLLDQGQTYVYADQESLPGFMAGGKQFVRISSGDSPSFVHELLKVCLDLQIDVVCPLRKNEILSLSEARQLFLEYNIKLIVPSKELINRSVSPKIKDGSIVVISDRKIIAKQGEILHVPEEIDSGVFLIDSSNEQNQYSIYTVD
jgi:hypothetical protein